MIQFKSGLHVEEVGDGTVWRLTRPLFVQIHGEHVTVPTGFETDFSSIPQIVRSVIPVLGRQNKASVLHDYCYVERWPDKRTADRWFLEAMKASGVSWVKRWTMYLAVVVGGHRAWRT